MTIYVVLIIIAVLIGMVISVLAFGTGGKRNKVFRDIYYSIEEVDGIGILYTKSGEYSAVIEMENPILKYSANQEAYYMFNRTLTSIAAALGEGYALHKQDILVRKGFKTPSDANNKYLTRRYFKYFEGRRYTENKTYIVITQENKKSKLFSYDAKKWNEFETMVRKVRDILSANNIRSRFLNEKECSEYADRYFAMNFSSENYSMENLKVSETEIGMGSYKAKVFSLVDVDSISLPAILRPYSNVQVENIEMPVDLMSALDGVPEAECVIYNQVLFTTNQKRELSALEKKRNRHSSMASAANNISVEDIAKVQDIIAREGKQLVYTHFNIVVCCKKDVDMQKPTNYLDNSFARLGIHLSKRAYNQLELFVGTFPGNCYRLSPDYDRFLTLSDAAACLFYKERQEESEDSPLQCYYTDRQGLPIYIDIMGKEGKLKHTTNSNFFCLGPSGSGKSFHINSVMRQLHEQDTDIVMVDTGNSYSSLCEYFGGKYISYTAEKPITMNPFNISKEEFGVEKINFLQSLILQIWLGSDAEPTHVQADVVAQIINEYYDVYFNGFNGYTAERRAIIRSGMLKELKDRPVSELLEQGLSDNNSPEKVEALIDQLEERRRKLKVNKLWYNSFYEYASEAISIICIESCIRKDPKHGIEPSNFRKALQPFYKGGKYEKTLNEQADTTLFNETFIVFEIDAIKDDKTLFPIVTLIIMDVFIQKMRLRKRRKVLCIEEAWKAIATPLMAEYIKYLYKTCRKFWGSVGVVTQELQDIVSSPIVKEAIINNSDIIMLLDQSKFRERFDEIKSILGLSDTECKKIFTINALDNKEGRSYFREVFVKRGEISGVYGVEESPEGYMTYTTERPEKEALELYKAELKCNHETAVEAYCRDWKLSRIEKPLEFAHKVLGAGKVLRLKDNKRKE